MIYYLYARMYVCGYVITTEGGKDRNTNARKKDDSVLYLLPLRLTLLKRQGKLEKKKINNHLDSNSGNNDKFCLS